MRRYLAPVSAVMLALISVSVFALGLGDIRLNSYLNQRLDAEIELVSASASELTTLEIRLADREQFERYGLERLPILNTLNFRVVRRPNGTAYIHVTSKEVIQEPFLTLLVEARWAQGRLLREYTLLLDPPTFADSPEAAKVETAETAPVAEPEVVTADSMPETVVEPSATVAVEPAPVIVAEPEVETSGDVIDVPTLEEDLADAGVDAAPAAVRPAGDSMPALGGTYGEIKRNETLWGIAARLRPDSSISMNQMMLAIYRANPEAFYGNINRMKQGYILRIPEYSEVTSISQREAFLEAKRMNEEWQAGSLAVVDYAAPVEDEEPSLSLVAPEEEVTEPDFGDAEITDEADTFDTSTEPDVLDLGAADEEFIADTGDDLDAGAVDLGVEETTDDRLTDVESETLQAMQDSTVDDAVEAESAEIPTLPEEAVTTDEPVTEDAAIEPEAMADDTLATEDDALVEEQVDAAVETETPAQAEPVVRGAKSGLLDQAIGFATSIVGMAVLGGVVVLVLIMLLMLRKRRAQSAARAAVGFDDWMADEEDSDVTIVAGDHATALTETGDTDEDDVTAVFSHGMEHKDTGTQRLEDDEEATQLLREAEKTQVVTPAQDKGGAGDFGGTQMLDENDPLSEADFHMAYGLYDQAAEVIAKAIKNDPDRKDLKVRLAEIHFAANNTSEFIAAAEALKAMVGAGDADWANIAIMGKQIAPQNPLFAGGSGGGGAVDLDFEAAADAEADSAPAEDSLDFDVLSSDSSPAPAAAQKTAASTDDGLDFDLDIGGGDDEPYDAEATMVGLADLDSETPAKESAEESSADDAGMDFDLDIGGAAADEPAPAVGADDESTQTEFDKALEELSAFVDTNLPESNVGDATQDDSDMNLDEYSFDESDAGGESGDDSGGDSLGEVGTKLDLARAYIDMGDPDGARGILEEVIADGDDQQKAEAQSLLDQIG